MKLKKKFGLVSAFLAAITSTGAMAHSELSVVGGIDYANAIPSGTPAQTTNTATRIGYGGGVLFQGGGPMFGGELGALYMGRKYSNSAATIDMTSKQLEFSALARVWFNRYVGIGLGGYYALAMGDLSFSDGTTATYDAQNLNKNDIGLVGSLNFMVPLSQSVSFNVDGRYLFGLTNLANDTAVAAAAAGGVTDFALKNREIQVLFGLTFAMGK